MAGKIEMYRDDAGQFRFRVKAKNGEVVASGESYPTKASLEQGVTAMLKAVSKAKIVDKTNRPR